ncbi:MAG TPA: putative lipid II flippase FtsW [Candidatus Tectomicrobia bacterium]
MVWVQRCNPFILIASLLLTGFGVVSVYSASAIVAMERHQDPYFFLRRQLFYASLGVVGMLGALQIDYRHLQRWARLSLVLMLLLLGLLFVPTLAKEAGGAKRWLQVGRLSFQPAELCKLTLVLYLAHRLAVQQPWRSRLLRHYLPLAAVIGALFLCTLLQPDFGTAVLLLGIAAIVLFIGGVPLRYLVGSLIVTVPFLYVAVVEVGFRWRRLLAFWDPWSVRLESGFQIIQSLLAFGKGGFVGVGPGAGKQKLFFLPEAHTDFVFAVIGEEFGFIGCLTVLGLFGVLLWHGMTVAGRSQNLFARYLAAGITSMVVLQAVMNVAVVVGFLPTKGLPLPFVSYGGSSLVVTLVSMGILLGISARLPVPKSPAVAVQHRHPIIMGKTTI